MTRTELLKEDVVGVKKWIVNFLLNGDFQYVNLATYEDYQYVDDVVYKIINDFSDIADGFSNATYFDTVATDLDDKLVLTSVSLSTFKDVEKGLGVTGFVLFQKYDNPDTYWHNELRYFKHEEDLIKAIENIIKLEVAGIDNKIEQLSELKSNILSKIED